MYVSVSTRLALKRPSHSVLHHAREIVGPLGRCQQVQVVGHQDIGVDAAVILLRCLEQPVQIAAIVFLGKAGRLPVSAGSNGWRCKQAASPLTMRPPLPPGSSNCRM